MSEYNVTLGPQAIKDITKLKKEDKKLQSKLWDLILDIIKSPYDGLGMPEELKGNMNGWWSRRINQKHRLIYRIREGALEIASCYGHYGDR